MLVGLMNNNTTAKEQKSHVIAVKKERLSLFVTPGREKMRKKGRINSFLPVLIMLGVIQLHLTLIYEGI